MLKGYLLKIVGVVSLVIMLMPVISLAKDTALPVLNTKNYHPFRV